MPAETIVEQDTEQHRYVAKIDGEVAGFVSYRMQGDDFVFVHTEVDDAFEGRGVGSALARQSLDDVRRQGVKVVPQCPFIAGWIERHPEYADLTAQKA